MKYSSLITLVLMALSAPVVAAQPAYCYTSNPLDSLSDARKASFDLMGSTVSIKTYAHHSLKGWRVWVPDNPENRLTLTNDKRKYYRVRLPSGSRALSIGFFSTVKYATNMQFDLIDLGYPARLTQTWKQGADSFLMHVRTEYALNDDRFNHVHCGVHILHSPGDRLVSEHPPRKAQRQASTAR